MKSGRIATIAALLLLAAPTVRAQTAADWVRRIDSLYHATPTWKVQFVQTIRYPVFDESETENGSFCVGPNNKFRLETTRHVVVSNGDTLWTHNLRAQQVTVERVARANETVRPADFLFNFKESYARQLCDSKGPGQCIYLKATDETSFIREMWLWADPKEAYVRRAVYKDINGNETTFEFQKFDFAFKADKDTFRYSPPPGVDVVTMP